MMTEKVLEVRDVSKRFGHDQALNHLSLTVHRGEVYALIGANGAGKTTLMRLITGLSPLTSGEIMLLGENAQHYRQALSRIGAIIEAPAAFRTMTVLQNLTLTAIQHGLNDKQAVEEAITFVGLEAKRNTKAKNLSLGQRQRLGLATAIVAKPDFLLLDEPINGLDPEGIIAFRELLARLNTEKQTTILIASHILSELYQVATTFGFLHHGTIIQELSKSALDAKSTTGLQISVDDVKKCVQVLDTNGISSFSVSGDRQVTITNADIDAAALTKLLVTAGVGVLGVTAQTTTLEDYYTALIAEQEGKL